MRVLKYKLGVLLFMACFLWDGVNKVLHPEVEGDKLRSNIDHHARWMPMLLRDLITKSGTFLALIFGAIELVGAFAVLASKLFQMPFYNVGKWVLTIYMVVEVLIYHNVWAKHEAEESDIDCHYRQICFNFILILGLNLLADETPPNSENKRDQGVNRRDVLE
jgi:uncharacterized membrane protein YphA (DoxX/SURF4 family)